MLYEIVSTEKVLLVYRVAGIGSRFLAWLIDMGIMLALLIVLIVVASAWELARAGFGSAVLMLASFAIQWGYFVLFEWLWYGQTPGKRLIGIRVIDVQGTGISFNQSATRNVLRVVDGLPLLIPDVIPIMYGVGFLAAAMNPQQRRLGDLAAGTLVVMVESRGDSWMALRQSFMGNAARIQLLRQRLEKLTRAQRKRFLIFV